MYGGDELEGLVAGHQSPVNAARMVRDLRQQAAAELVAAMRRETGTIDRVRAALGSDLTLRLRNAAGGAGHVVDVGADYVLLDRRGQAEARPEVWAVPLAAVVSWQGLPLRGRAASGVGRPPSFGTLLLRLLHARTPVVVSLVDGDPVAGLVAAVWADAVDLWVSGAEAPHGAGGVALTVPFGAIALVALPPTDLAEVISA